MKRKDIPSPVITEKVHKIDLSENSSKAEELLKTVKLRDKEKNQEAAKNKFPSKNIFLFEAESISYELPDEMLD